MVTASWSIARTGSDVESSVAALADAIITELKELDTFEDGTRAFDKSEKEATKDQRRSTRSTRRS